MTWQAPEITRARRRLLTALLVACAAGALLAPEALAGSALEPANGSSVATSRPTFVVSVAATDRFPQVQVSSQSSTGTLGFPLTSRLGICLPSPVPGRGSCSLSYDLAPGTYYWLLVYQSTDGKIHISGPLRFKVAGGAPPPEPGPPAPPPAASPPPASPPSPGQPATDAPVVGGSPARTGDLPRPPDGGHFGYDSPEAPPFSGARVVVHYVTSGLDAPPLNDDDVTGVPDYVEQVAAAADTALGYYAGRGYRLPRPDGGGPDDRPDVYIEHFAYPDLYGVTIAPVAAAGGTFVVVSSRLDQSPKVTRGSLAGTVAHELFHVVQYSYLPNGAMPDWIAEGTASALALSVFPKIADLVTVEYLDLWLREPWRSLNDQRFSCDRCYGGAWWWMFLEELDPKLVPGYFERLSRLGGPRAVGSGVSALDAALRSRGSGGLEKAFSSFAVALYRNGFSPAPAYAVRAAWTELRTPIHRLNGLSTHYVPILVPAHARRLDIALTLRSGPRVGVGLVVGGPKGRMLAPKAAGPRSITFSVVLRSAKERRRITLVVAAGREAASSYDVSVSAAK